MTGQGGNGSQSRESEDKRRDREVRHEKKKRSQENRTCEYTVSVRAHVSITYILLQLHE